MLQLSSFTWNHCPACSGIGVQLRLEWVSRLRGIRSRSKEKRTDCPLVTLGMVLDGSGFVRRSKTFAGNVSEGSTLETMLTGLGAPPGG